MIMLKRYSRVLVCVQLLVCSLWFTSCNTIDLYEKVVPIPKHQWEAGFKPQFTFTIKDTASSYRLFFVVRHNNKYNYNNIWVKLTAKGPTDSAQSFRLELPLANKEGWLAKGMDDIFEHWVQVNKQMEGFSLFQSIQSSDFQFKKSGDYTFTVEQIMRNNPLPEVMNVGLRIEKKTP